MSETRVWSYFPFMFKELNCASALLFAAIAIRESSLRAEAEISEPIRAICAVEAEGKGNAQAAQAWQTLTQAEATRLPEILTAMAGTNDLAANWLRAAVETIADRELKSGKQLPVLELGQFLLDTAHSSRARRLAFELIARVDPLTSERLLVGMIHDPSPELRRDAVQKIIDQAGHSLSESNRPAATLLFEQSLTLARDVDQIDSIAKNLRSLGQTVDLAKALGFVTQWKVVGPFDSTGGKGILQAYPPEESIDLTAEYNGKIGKVRWQSFSTPDEYGVTSMNKPFTALKGVAAYAYTEFYSEHGQRVELRLGSENAFKVWLNGKFLFGQDEYHRNHAIDQYRMSGEMQPGRNVILVKVCQNEQTEDWAGDWEFQLRVCDSSGTALHSVPAVSSNARGNSERTR